MYLMHVDESGQAKIKSHHDNGLYILVGTIIYEGNWKKIEKGMAELKKSIFPELNPNEWELHAHDIWNDKYFFKELKSSISKKEKIFSQIVNFVCNSEIDLISIIFFKDMVRKQYSKPVVMKYSWGFLIERFDYFLKQQPEGTNNGLIVVDSSEKTTESEIKNIISKITKSKSYYRNVTNIIKFPIFEESHLYDLIQLTDMIAYIIHKHYRGDPKFSNWFEGLRKKMYHPNDKWNLGITEFPKIGK